MLKYATFVSYSLSFIGLSRSYTSVSQLNCTSVESHQCTILHIIGHMWPSWLLTLIIVLINKSKVASNPSVSQSFYTSCPCSSSFPTWGRMKNRHVSCSDKAREEKMVAKLISRRKLGSSPYRRVPEEPISLSPEGRLPEPLDTACHWYVKKRVQVISRGIKRKPRKRNSSIHQLTTVQTNGHGVTQIFPCPLHCLTVGQDIVCRC